MSEDYEVLMTILGRYIANHLRGAAVEQFHPSLNADDMDEKIKYGMEQAARLRKVRAELEDILTGVLPTP